MRGKFRDRLGERVLEECGWMLGGEQAVRCTPPVTLYWLDLFSGLISAALGRFRRLSRSAVCPFGAGRRRGDSST